MSGVSYFFDPVLGASEPSEPQIVLHRRDVGEYALGCRFGYFDATTQAEYLVPSDIASFRTDLASIPWFFAWLVPALGTHIPAALLHDGLVVEVGGEPTHIGPPVERLEADRIFRDAMKVQGTRVVRRWIVWTAVALATLWTEGTARFTSTAMKVALIINFGLVALLGVLATLELLNAEIGGYSIAIPWMPGGIVTQVLGGAVGAVVLPLLLSVQRWLWPGETWKAVAIGGVALALLLHVTAALIVVYGFYLGLEWLSPDDGLKW